MSGAEYRKAIESRDGVCDACHRESAWPLVLDHDHVTNKNRGVICHHCNVALGFARDDITVLERLITYLKEH